MLYLIYPSLVAILWGALVVLIKDTKAPAIYGLGISLTGAAFFVLLSCFIFNFPFISIEPKILVYIIAIGVSRYILATWFFYESIKVGDLSIATPITGLKIIIVTVISATLGLERLNFILTAAILLATAGFMTVTFHIRKLDNLNRWRMIKCISFALAAALCWSAGDIFVMKVKYAGTLLLTSGSLLLSWALYLILIFSFKKQSVLFGMHGLDQKKYFLHGMFSLALAYFILNFSLIKIGIIKTNIITHLWPIIASIIGYMRYKEKLVISKIFGFIMLAASFILIVLG